MDDRIIQFRVGVLVVATCVIAGILLVLFGETPNFVRHQYTLFIEFQSAPGVSVGTPVRKNGISIGRVRRVDLLDNSVIVTAWVDGNRTLRQSEVCRIVTDNILGDAALEFVPGDGPAAGDMFADQDYMRGIVAGNPLKALDVLVDLEDDVTQALASIRGAGDDVGNVARSLNAVVDNNKDQFQRIMQQAETAIARFDTAMGGIEAFVSDTELKENLRRALSEVPELLADARDTLGALQSVADSAERNLSNLEGFTEPLGERGEHLVANVEQTVARMDELMIQLVQFSESLNNSDGSLGRFVNDPQLYESLNQAAININQLTRRLRPILDDARVIADKVARDPGRIVGLKDLLRGPQSGIKR